MSVIVHNKFIIVLIQLILVELAIAIYTHDCYQVLLCSVSTKTASS